MWGALKCDIQSSTYANAFQLYYEGPSNGVYLLYGHVLPYCCCHLGMLQLPIFSVDLRQGASGQSAP
jgi:hypothetical protein